MKYRFLTCDVFTDVRFGGNPLAVVPNAVGLTDRQMQQIAREFNFSESSFVFPPKNGNTKQVRIFTPTTEVPFAGHPNIGTAFVLASTGELGELADNTEIMFEEKAGLVPISVRKSSDGQFVCELKAPEALSLGATISAQDVAAALSLSVDDVSTRDHVPQVASVGLPFLVAELASQSALERAKPVLERFENIARQGVTPYIHVYVRSDDEYDLRTRMFAPFDGVPEDPATGSANCALTAMLAQLDEAPAGSFEWRIAQGVEMGRPSLLKARVRKDDGKVAAVWIAGSCVMFSDGELSVE